MKLFIVLAAVALAQGAKLDRTYLPPNAQASAGSAFLQTPLQSNGFQEQTGTYSNNGFSNTNNYAQNGAYSNFEARPERAQAALERNAAILRQDNSNDGETYAYAYETENGIFAEENGVATNGVQAQGGYTYTGDDGQVYSIRYTADENGFQPQGDHLPTPPPVPEEILKALEQNARDEAAGIYDDGSYQEAKYGNIEEQYYNNAQSNAYNNGQANNYNNAQANNYHNAQANNYNKPQPNNYNNADSVVTNNALLRNAAAESSNSAAGVQTAYLPPFAQRNNQRSGLIQSTRNNAAQSGSSAAGVQKAYLPPFAQGNNQRIGARQPNFNNAIRSGNSVTGVQKAYLPPLAQSNNQRSGVRQPTFNTRDGYRY